MTRAAACWIALLALACGLPTGPEQGYLAGIVTIGPLRPVEIIGQPPPKPPPGLCQSQAFRILRADNRAEVTRFNADADCRFRVALAPGRYTLEYLGQRPAFTKDLPLDFEI